MPMRLDESRNDVAHGHVAGIIESISSMRAIPKNRPARTAHVGVRVSPACRIRVEAIPDRATMNGTMHSYRFKIARAFTHAVDAIWRPYPPLLSGRRVGRQTSLDLAS